MTALLGHEFVAHVFVAASGRNAPSGQRYLVDLWRRCCEEFSLDDAMPPHRETPPEGLAATSARGGVVAARAGTAPGVHQVVLRRPRDVLVLSLIRAPEPAGRDAWEEAEDRWVRVLPPPTPGVLGEVRILQARLTDPAAALDPAALDPALSAAVVAAAGESERPPTGVVWKAPPLGPFAVWEAAPPGDPADAETRLGRRILVVAPADRDAQLSAWTWSRGTPELTPFPRYLLQAAKIRYELRVRAADADPTLRRRVDAAIAPLLRLADEVALSGRDPDVRALDTASAELVRLQAGQLGLVDRASRLREMRRTVEVAARNMTAYTAGEKPTGLFADDAALAEWAGRQLDNDATYLEAALDRARSVSALADQLVSRGMQDRRERFDLALTGVIGAILMVLAAMQSLKLEFALQKPLLGAVVSGLGAAALLVPIMLLRLAVPNRAWSAALVCLVVGSLVGTLPWLAFAIDAEIHKTPLPVLGVVAWSVVGAVVGAGLTGLWFRWRQRGRSAAPPQDSGAIHVHRASP